MASSFGGSNGGSSQSVIPTSNISIFPKTSRVSFSHSLLLLHSNLWGVAPITSSSGYKYYITFINAYSRYTWIYMLRAKNKALPTFISLKNQVELELGFKIKQIQYDWSEYQAFTTLLQECGIIPRVSCPHIPMNKIELLSVSTGTLLRVVLPYLFKPLYLSSTEMKLTEL
uniref:Uncharacterized protein n=1 Tax=Cannabis sativa TaxID=3483 RepID=A0A803PD76_CANSA